MAIIQPTVDALDEPTVMLQIRKIAGTVDSKLEAVNDEITNIQEQIDGIKSESDRITALENEMDTVQSDLTAVENKNTEQDTAISDNETAIQNEIKAREEAISAEVTARQNADITASELLYSEGILTLKLTRQSGDIQETVDVPFFKTVTLIPTSTERAFKLQFTMWDDSVYDTNEFVIPAGGGTEVSVTGVTIGDGASENSFKVSIQLSDASTIASNDYPFPTATVSPYPTDVMLSLSGNILSCDITLSNNNHVDGSVDLTNLLSTYATTEDLSDLQEQVTGLKLSKPTNNQIQLNGDNVTIVDSVTGSIDGYNLTIGVNGVNSSPISIPSGKDDIKYVCTGKNDYNVTSVVDIPVSLFTSISQEEVYSVGSSSGYSIKNIAGLFINNAFFGTNDDISLANIATPGASVNLKLSGNVKHSVNIDAVINNFYNFYSHKNGTIIIDDPSILWVKMTNVSGPYVKDGIPTFDIILKYEDNNIVEITVSKDLYYRTGAKEYVDVGITGDTFVELSETEITFD